MKVLKAEHAGACYGVQRALDLAYRAAGEEGPVCTLGPLIHNPQVVDELAASGVVEAADVDDVAEGTVVIRSHGVVPEVYERAEAKGLRVVDATCPHVARAQKAAARLARDGRLVVVVGEAGHPEVEGICAHGRAAGGEVIAVTRPEELPEGFSSAAARVGVVVQTTQSRDTFDAVVSALREAGVDLDVKDTVCTATRKRQEAAAALADKVDAFVVIGGRNSSNTTRLFEICRALCDRSYHIERADEIDPAWFAGCETVGVTAGASTPENQIEAVVARLEEIGA